MQADMKAPILPFHAEAPEEPFSIQSIPEPFQD